MKYTGYSITLALRIGVIIIRQRAKDFPYTTAGNSQGRQKTYIVSEGYSLSGPAERFFRIDRSFQAFFRKVKEGSGKAGYPRYKVEGQCNAGLLAFAVLSDGTVINNPKHLRKAEKKLIRKQRRLSTKEKGSKNRMKARKKVAKAHRKVRNQRADFHHKIPRAMVSKYGCIAVEDLNIKGMVKNHHLAKSISDAGWGQFQNYLAYKAENAGCRVENVAPHHTSINCSRCGERVYKTLGDRIHTCPFCGLVLDRDHNAAINILNRAGTARINAWGEAVHQGPSLNQEAASVKAR